MSAFTVDTRQLPGLAEIVASLPLSLRDAGNGPPQIIGVTGTGTWAAQATAAVRHGALAIVVEAPVLAGLKNVSTAAQSRVVLAWDFAANPGVHAAAAEAEAMRGGAGIAKGAVTVGRSTDIQVALLDLLVAAVRVFGEISMLTVRHRDHHCLYLTGHLEGGAPLTLSVVVTNAYPFAMDLRLLTGEGGLDVHVPSPATAAPAEVRVADADGERLLPTVWVTSRRASWQDAAAVAAGATSGDIAELRRAVSLVPGFWSLQR